MGWLSEILLECLTILTNTSFYRPNWAKPSDRCVSSLINGPDARVTVNRYDLISALWSLNGRSGFALRDLRYRTHQNGARRITIRRSWCVSAHSIMVVTTRLQKAPARLIDRWSGFTRSTRGFSALRPIDVPPSATSPETKITVWDLVPHRKILVNPSSL